MLTVMLTYDAVDGTRVADAAWTAHPVGYRRFEQAVLIGEGTTPWEAASAAVLRWEVKTRSGFAVECAGPDPEVMEGQDCELVAMLGPIRLREPVRVVTVVNGPDRCGFSYGTREGHPVSGEEAFIVHRSPDGKVWFTLRSLTRPAPGIRKLAFPIALLAQRFYRRRYARALVAG